MGTSLNFVDFIFFANRIRLTTVVVICETNLVTNIQQWKAPNIAIYSIYISLAESHICWEYMCILMSQW